MLTMTNAADFKEKYKSENGFFNPIIVGGGYGDTGKRKVESILLPVVDVNIRPGGGGGTGGTCYHLGFDGTPKKMAYSLVPAGWGFSITSIVGNWVLLNILSFLKEKEEVIKIVGDIKAPLLISKRAPLYLKVYSVLEAWIEYIKGAHAVGTTKKGIGPNIAAVDLRTAPLVGHLLDQDVLYRMIKETYSWLEPILKVMAKKSLLPEPLESYNPKEETEMLLSLLPQIKDSIVNIEPLIRDFIEKKLSILVSMTQGFGLNFIGSYPFNSSARTLAADANIPFRKIGPVILVEKAILSRVGGGTFATKFDTREFAEEFPKANLELFDLSGENKKRLDFLAQMRDKINNGVATPRDFLCYFQVLLGERGTISLRGRNLGWPDFYMIGCAVYANNAEMIAYTRMDAFSGLEFSLPICIGYELDGNPMQRPAFPLAYELERVEPIYDTLKIECKNDNIAGIDNYEDLPHSIKQFFSKVKTNTGLDVNIISTLATDKGTILRI